MRWSLNYLAPLLAVLVAAGGFHGCASRHESSNATRAPRGYHCPMHPTFHSDRPGDCPICSMRLVPDEEATPTPRVAAGKKRWRSTMNAGEIADHPGKDSMGMEMVPVEVEETGSAPGVAGLAVVTLPLERQQAIGVRTEEVRRGALRRDIRAAGRVEVDERRLHHVAIKFDGWIEVLAVDATGNPVKRGQLLFAVYSPEVLATQEEFLIALETSRKLAGAAPEIAAGASSLLEAARQRLRLWDIPESQIERLEQGDKPLRAIPFYSHVDGIVLEKKAVAGHRVMAGDELFTVADLSSVWVIADVYDSELPFVAVGQDAVVRLSYLAGVERKGKVDYVYPTLDPVSHTARLRIELDNRDRELRPGMYATVELEVDLGERLLVPDSALLHAGKREVAFVDRGEGRFEPREVEVGVRTADFAEVLRGLEAGERVVVGANFLVDAESQLKSALAAMADRP